MNCTLTVVPQGAAGAAIRLEATGNESAKRVDEFLAALDKRIGVAPAPATHGAGAATGFAGAAAPAVLAPNAQGVKKTSKLLCSPLFGECCSYSPNLWMFLADPGADCCSPR